MFISPLRGLGPGGPWSPTAWVLRARFYAEATSNIFYVVVHMRFYVLDVVSGASFASTERSLTCCIARLRWVWQRMYSRLGLLLDIVFWFGIFEHGE